MYQSLLIMGCIKISFQQQTKLSSLNIFAAASQGSHSASFGAILYFHLCTLPHICFVPGNTSVYTVLPSFFSVPFPYGPIELSSIFCPLIDRHILRFTHHSFISISPRVIWVERISYLPCLRQSLQKPLRHHSYLKIHPFPPFRPYPSLKLLVSPSPPYFFFHSASAAVFPYFLQS